MEKNCKQLSGKWKEWQFKKYCTDITKVENYDKLYNTDDIYDCHHRLETHNSDGEKRLVQLTSKELKALGMYYNRPPEELIFLTHSEHTALHMAGNNHGTHSDVEKIKESLKNNPNSRQNRAKLLSKKWHENNEGLTWNQFQKAHRGDWR